MDGAPSLQPLGMYGAHLSSTFGACLTQQPAVCLWAEVASDAGGKFELGTVDPR